MDIDIRVRNTQLTDQIRAQTDKHFRKVARQVTPLARLHLELRGERNPAIADNKVAEATLHLKGAVLRAQQASADMAHSIEQVAEKMSRQVKRYSEKRHSRNAANRVKAA